MLHLFGLIALVEGLCGGPSSRLAVAWMHTCKCTAAVWLGVQVSGRNCKFHVLLTSYELLMGAQDRPRLSRVHWHGIVVDEGHR